MTESTEEGKKVARGGKSLKAGNRGFWGGKGGPSGGLPDFKLENELRKGGGGTAKGEGGTFCLKKRWSSRGGGRRPILAGWEG